MLERRRMRTGNGAGPLGKRKAPSQQSFSGRAPAPICTDVDRCRGPLLICVGPRASTPCQATAPEVGQGSPADAGSNPVLDRRAVAQRGGLTGQHGHVAPGIVESLVAPEPARVRSGSRADRLESDAAVRAEQRLPEFRRGPARPRPALVHTSAASSNGGQWPRSPCAAASILFIG